MIRGRYVGHLREPKGKTALLRDVSNDYVIAQFDGNDDWRVSEKYKLKHPETGVFLCHGWHKFPRSSFEVFKVEG